MKIPSKDLSTLAVHAGDRKKPGQFTPTVTPIHTASSFFYDSVEELGQVFEQEAEGSVYTRFGNPTAGAFEAQMAALEGADYAVATSSGMAALNLALTAALTDRRRSIVAADCIYGQTISMLMKVFEPQGVDVTVCRRVRFGAIRGGRRSREARGRALGDDDEPPGSGSRSWIACQRSLASMELGRWSMRPLRRLY